MMEKTFSSLLNMIFMNMGSPFTTFEGLSPPSGHICFVQKLQDAVLHRSGLADHSEHLGNILHHSQVSPFIPIEGLFPPSGHIFGRPRNYRTRSFIAAASPIMANTLALYFIIVRFLLSFRLRVCSHPPGISISIGFSGTDLVSNIHAGQSDGLADSLCAGGHWFISLS